MRIKKTAMALVMMTGLIAGTAQAEGTYIGINFGQSSIKDWVTEEDVDGIFFDEFGSLPSSSEAEDTDAAFKIFVGLPVTDNFDIRIGYTNLGEGTFQGSNGSVHLDGSVENKGVFADALLKFKPAERLSLYGKLGMAFMKTDLTVSAVGPGGTAGEELNSDSMVIVPGLGLSVDIVSGFGLALEYERYLDVGDDEETGQSDVDVVSAGLYYRF